MIHILYGDGVHDDTEAWAALQRGEPVVYEDGTPANNLPLREGKYYFQSPSPSDKLESK